jgi:hypothetical protein
MPRRRGTGQCTQCGRSAALLSELHHTTSPAGRPTARIFPAHACACGKQRPEHFKAICLCALPRAALASSCQLEHSKSSKNSSSKGGGPEELRLWTQPRMHAEVSLQGLAPLKTAAHQDKPPLSSNNASKPSSGTAEQGLQGLMQALQDTRKRRLDALALLQHDNELDENVKLALTLLRQGHG